jgi:uncharacterized protein (TIGR02284 family)
MLTVHRSFGKRNCRKTQGRGNHGNPAKAGSVSAAFHRGWMNIKSIVTGGIDAAIIAECERGEDAAVENYQSVMKQNLPPNVLPVAKHQFTEIKRSHDRIRALDQAA